MTACVLNNNIDFIGKSYYNQAKDKTYFVQIAEEQRNTLCLKKGVIIWHDSYQI